MLGFALGTGRLINNAFPFIPVAVAVVFGILMVEGFVVTTLDTAVRLCRYLIEEFWRFVLAENAPRILSNPVFNTALAVGLMLAFAMSSTVRQMWPVFGSGNQLMGALALITVTVWLVQRARTHLYALLPATFMIVTTLTALVILVRANFGVGGNRVLGFTAGALFFLAVGVVVVGVSRFAVALQAHARPAALKQT
jgi:carbon starvation protein